jgi:hypothetical protein
MTRLSLTMLAALALSACGAPAQQASSVPTQAASQATQATPAPVASSSAKSLTLRKLDSGTQSGISDLKTVTCHSQDELAALYKEHAPSATLPQVDFTKEMVVAVFMGERGTAGYSVDFQDAMEEDTQVSVSFAEKTPAAGSSNAQVITYPYVIAAIPRSDKPVKFVDLTTR